MGYPVFIEGLDKTGKTTLCSHLAPRLGDDLALHDRGPWTPWVYHSYHGNRGSEHAHAWLLDRRAPAVVVFVRRDLDELVELQRGEERYSRRALERQEELYRKAFERWPPRALIEVMNDSTGPEALGRAVEERLREWLRTSQDRAEGA